MSYDVHLDVPCTPAPCYCRCHETPEKPGTETVFKTNYTSNYSPMWDAAGCRLRDWAYEKAAGRTAATLIEPLRTAIKTMADDPKRFIAMEPENGWGSYEGALAWLRSILRACEKYPEASVYVSN